jgi:hypothetical protein
LYEQFVNFKEQNGSKVCGFANKTVCLQSGSITESLNQNANKQQITEK